MRRIAVALGFFRLLAFLGFCVGCVFVYSAIVMLKYGHDPKLMHEKLELVTVPLGNFIVAVFKFLWNLI